MSLIKKLNDEFTKKFPDDKFACHLSIFKDFRDLSSSYDFLSIEDKIHKVGSEVGGYKYYVKVILGSKTKGLKELKEYYNFNEEYIREIIDMNNEFSSALARIQGAASKTSVLVEVLEK